MSDSGNGGDRVRRAARATALLVAARTAWRSVRHRAAVPPAAPTGLDGHPEYDASERTVPSNRKVETLVVVLLVCAALGGICFVALYAIVQTQTQLLGASMGLTLLCIAAACILLGKLVVPQETEVEPRDVLLREEAVEEVVQRVESVGDGVSRRGLLAGAGGLAGVCLGGAALAPVASMGPPAHLLHQIAWRRGIRLVDESGAPYAARDIQIGDFYLALPEGGNPESLSASVNVVRLPERYIDLPRPRQGWAPQGIMAYSRICPHAGCAINLYRYPLDTQTTNDPPAFTCPCHYSTFTPGDGGALIFGPAGRALPQLPLMIDSDGYLRCAGPYDEDVGPSWWGVKRVTYSSHVETTVTSPGGLGSH